ncbi:MAG: flippase-like domain-containing protein [Proteobacteria bacterium]|nr:flippase-like domain-containing protein [Pseudomonadota bacterium]MBU1714845.1 flippase-like domain-containing protein [Pseudomonadota bacterium]
MQTAIKALITSLLLYVILRNIDLPSVSATIKGTEISWLAVAYLLQTASTGVAAFRWNLIMERLDFSESRLFYLKSYFQGVFFNQVMPGSIGGDAFRVIDLGAKGYSKIESFYGVMIDRGVGLASLILLTLLASFLGDELFPAWLIQLIRLVSVIGLAGFILVMFLHRLKVLSRVRIFRPMVRISEHMSTVYRQPITIIFHAILSLAAHLLGLLTFWALAKAINMEVNFTILLIAIPPSLLLTIVPISLAGWGVREGAMVGILMLAGLVKAEILSLSVLFGLLLIATSIPGAYLWVRHKKSLATKEPK